MGHIPCDPHCHHKPASSRANHHPPCSVCPTMTSPFETLLAQESALSSPVYDKAGVLYVTSPETGEIIRIDITGDAGNIRASPSTFGFTDGFPLGIVFDSTGALFCVDGSHKALLSRPSDEKVFRILASSCENRPFLGPNAVTCDAAGNLFFLDGGADGETGIDRPRGSLYQVSIATMALRPILNQCLASPRYFLPLFCDRCACMCNTLPAPSPSRRTAPLYSWRKQR